MAEKKKILYIVEAMGGGVFTYIVDLANELVNKYDMYIAYAVRKQTPKNYKDYFDKRIHLIEVRNFGRAINPIKDIAAFFEVKKIAAEIKPDLIHLHSSKAGAIGRVAFDGKIPMFYTPHGYSFLMENCNPAKRRVFKLIESVCAKRNCTTISCSVGEHQETLKLTKNAAYVNNGINIYNLEGVCGEGDIAIIHDGVRPLVEDEVLTDVIRTAQKFGNGVTSMPYNEQIFVVSKEDETTTTQYIPRETLRRVSTPQAYEFSNLDRRYHEAFEKEIGIYGSSYTNTMMVELGEVLHFAAGSDKNIKLTTKDNLEMFKAYLNGAKDTWLK